MRSGATGRPTRHWPARPRASRRGHERISAAMAPPIDARDVPASAIAGAWHLGLAPVVLVAVAAAVFVPAFARVRRREPALAPWTRAGLFAGGLVVMVGRLGSAGDPRPVGVHRGGVLRRPAALRRARLLVPCLLPGLRRPARPPVRSLAAHRPAAGGDRDGARAAAHAGHLLRPAAARAP